MSSLEVLEVTDRAGELREPAWLSRAEAVHRQLRPQMPPDYADKMRRVFAGGGRMLVAHDGRSVCGVAVWRCHENTFLGRFLYVDDLVTDEAQRSRGVGKALLDRCEVIAREAGCEALVLDSGVQRDQAHKFYFREGLTVAAFNFKKKL
ncbi:MAG: GNAT family N-acetyltransferase [Polyangiaceae bacterium]